MLIYENKYNKDILLTRIKVKLIRIHEPKFILIIK